MALHIINHPMVQHKLTIMRKKETGTREFRELLKEIGMLMGYEVTRDFPLVPVQIETPMQTMVAHEIAGKKVVVVPILRAGLGMVDGLLTLIPAAKVGHIGMYRDETTHQPVFYYYKMPEGKDRMVILTDPMRMMCLVAAPEGLKRVQSEFPEVDIYTASLDEKLNDDCYILPGLGDAGDRIFGTK